MTFAERLFYQNQLEIFDPKLIQLDESSPGSVPFQGDGGVLPHHEPACQEAGNSDERRWKTVVLIEHGSSADGSNPVTLEEVNIRFFLAR